MLKLRKVKEGGNGKAYAAFFTPASKNANHSPESAYQPVKARQRRANTGGEQKPR